MARSQFVWLLVFEDTTTKYVKAQTISQMMYCDVITKRLFPTKPTTAMLALHQLVERLPCHF